MSEAGFGTPKENAGRDAPEKTPTVAGVNGPVPQPTPSAAAVAQATEVGKGMAGGAGEALPSAVQFRFERGFGESFAGVRIHDTSASHELARSMDARAFTVGQDVHFGEGEYQPETVEGDHLLAHELTHTVQQRGAPAGLQHKLESGGGGTLEAEADHAADAVLSGGRAGPITRGVGPQVARQDANGRTLTRAQLVAMFRQRIQQARAMGGPAEVASEIRRLRSVASGEQQGALEEALSILTPEEQAALNGNQAPAPAETPTETPPPNHPQGENPQGQNTQGQNTQGQNTQGQNTQGQNTQGQTTENTPVAANENDPNAPDPTQEDEPPAEDTPGNPPANADGPPAPGGERRPGERPRGTGGGPAVTAEGQNGPTTAQALQPAPELPADQRAAVEQELAFHESWRGLQGGAGSRAGHLALSTLTNDVLPGLQGGVIQSAGGLAINFVAQRCPVPGIGNIAGGVMSGIWLFGGGARQAGQDIGRGWDAIFNGAGMGPWLRAAEIVGMVKAILDLIGNICNVLSGLAYAFAAIAAVGGLLSVFFPPLAFLVPYIPTAINFGRMCGAVGSVCMAISNLISPIPPILRAIHIITSNDDPIRLAQQEQRYHGEMQGAIANYASAGIDAGIAAGQARGGTLRQRVGAGVRTGINPLNQARQLGSAIRPNVQTARAGYRDLRAGNTEVRQALGMQGQTNAQIRRDGDIYGGMHLENGQGGVHGANARRTEEQLRQSQQRLQEVEGRRGATRRTQNRIHRLEGQLGQQQNAANIVAGRGVDGGTQGEFGNTLGGAVGIATSALSTEAGGLPNGQQPELTRNARGHVVLPAPPGRLEDVDSLQAEVDQLQDQLRAQEANTATATHAEVDARQNAQQLSALNQEVAGRQTEMAATGAEHERVNQDNQSAQQQTAQQNSSSEGGLQRAAQTLGPIIGPARTVNGIVQRVPSNRFFNVAGTQRSLNEFVQGLDQFAGQGEDNQQQNQQANQVLDQRTQVTQQAGQQREQNQTEVQQFNQRVQNDEQATRQVAANHNQQVQESRREEQTIQQRIEAKKQEKAQKWDALVSWAAQHHAVRTAVHGAE